MIYRLHILPFSPLFDGQRTIDLSDPARQEEVFTSLSAWVEAAKPPVLLEHERTLGERGQVVGIERDSDGIYAVCDLHSPPQARHASAHIAWNHRANDDSRWPAALLEVSITAVPQFVIGQKEIESEYVSRMSAPLINMDAGITPDDTPAGTPALTEVQMDEILEILRAIESRLDRLEAPAPVEEVEVAAEESVMNEEEIAETAAEAAAEDVKEDVVADEIAQMVEDLAAAHARIAELEAELEKTRKTEDELESVMSANPVLAKYRNAIRATGKAASVAESVKSVMSSRTTAGTRHTAPRRSADDQMLAEIDRLIAQK